MSTALKPRTSSQAPHRNLAADSLLLDLYACPTTPARWPEVLDRLCTETGARSTVIQSFRLEGSRLRQRWSVQDTHTDRFVAPRNSRLSADDNPRLDLTRVQLGVDRMVRDEDLFGRDEHSLRDLREQLAAVGLGRFVGLLWQVDRHNYVSLALHRAADDRRDFSGAQLQRLAALAPHVHQAAGLAHRIEAGAELELRLRRHFDRLRCGVLICDAQGQVCWSNRGAEQLISRADSPIRLHAGALSGRTPQMSETLLNAIAATSLPGGDGAYLSLGHASRPLHLALQPLGDALPYDPGSVLLILTTPDMETPISAHALVHLFALTPAESRLVCALVAGQTLEQYAAQRGVSLGTVRGQLKQVQAKTGTSRQSELVRLVLSSAAAQIAD